MGITRLQPLFSAKKFLIGSFFIENDRSIYFLILVTRSEMFFILCDKNGSSQ